MPASDANDLRDARESPRRPSAMARFGPVAAIALALVLVAGIATAKGRGPEAGTDAAPGSSADRAADPTEHPDLPITYREADNRGEAGDHDWGECDVRTGRVRLPSVYAPPCVADTSGARGGATYTGVTAETIKVVVYLPPPGSDITAALSGLLDDDEVQQRTRLRYVEMLEDVYETYGRRIEVETMVGSGAASDEAAAVADAVRVAREIKPFAVINGPALTAAFAVRLAREGIMCIGCGISVPDSVYQDSAPYMWGEAPTPEQFLRNLGDFIVRRLLDRPAEHAGPGLQGKTRVFGSINFEQDPPVFSGLGDIVQTRGRLRGYEAAVRESYILDVARLPERAASIIARMKSAGVTTIIFLGDPLMPGYLTQAAAAEDYHPEWIIAGTVLTDTTTLGRTYVPEQWSRAFGLSSLPARTALERQEQWRLHEWYYGEAPEAALTSAVIYPRVNILMTGIHMAGPNLTPETFQGGMFKYPPSGGGPTAPQISYGNHGNFPDPDYLGVDDMAEIWWDPQAEGPDEQGKSEALGMWRYANGGTRVLPGRMPAGPTSPHDPALSPTIFDAAPPQDQFPTYPPPEGSPAAGG